MSNNESSFTFCLEFEAIELRSLSIYFTAQQLKSKVQQQEEKCSTTDRKDIFFD